MRAISVAQTAEAAIGEIEREEAWQEYLGELRGVEPARYDEVEPWAWERLQVRLGRLAVRGVA